MRNEKQVLDTVLDFARSDARVRAVWMNGSRVNPNVSQDIFCDYDIVFAVTDPRDFLVDQSWIARFGELIIMQQNDWSEGDATGYIFLMLFSDGIRIDLSFDPVDYLDALLDDSLTVVLLDKDKRIGPLPPPADTGYHTQKPSREEFDDVTNEFWWCATNVAKGIWRDEFCYAKYMYQVIVKGCVIKLLTWYIGLQHDWAVNSGLYGKWFKAYLPPALWAAFERTYAGVDYDALWEALFEAGALVREVGLALADALGYDYPIEDDERVSAYLRKVRELPKDAETF